MKQLTRDQRMLEIFGLSPMSVGEVWPGPMSVQDIWSGLISVEDVDALTKVKVPGGLPPCNYVGVQ